MNKLYLYQSMFVFIIHHNNFFHRKYNILMTPILYRIQITACLTPYILKDYIFKLFKILIVLRLKNGPVVIYTSVFQMRTSPSFCRKLFCG